QGLAHLLRQRRGGIHMATPVEQVMSRGPIICRGDESVARAAEQMRDHDVGNVLVQENGGYGIVTDRDIVVRALADHRDPESTPVSSIATHDLCTMKCGSTVEEAVRLMRDYSVRRVVVVDDDVPIGIVSLGDLAM